MEGLSKRQEKWQTNSDFVLARIPPHAIDFEKTILGAIMLEKNAFFTVSEILSSDCFYLSVHQTIFAAMERLAARNTPIDLLTVSEELGKMAELDNIGGDVYLVGLLNDVTSSAHIEAHARVVLDKFIKREISSLCSDIINKSFEDRMESIDIVEVASNGIFRIGSKNIKKSYTHIGELVLSEMVHLQNLMHKKEDLTGVPSGYRTLDVNTAGWQQSDLIIIAARPSVGKTAFALNIARNAALNEQKPTGVMFFSLEMSKRQVAQRLISMQAGIQLNSIRRGKIGEEEFNHIIKSCEKTIINAPIFIDDTSSINIFEIRAKARRAVSKNNVGLIIVDYLQLMDASLDGGNREQEISKISRDLKALAKDLSVPVIALSQLNRDVDKRLNQIPILSDLRESGAIEQDADMVLFLYRPDYQQDHEKIDPSLIGMAFIKIAKHRNGALETLPFYTDFKRQIWMDQVQYDKIDKTPSFNRNVVDFSEPQVRDDYLF